jgi:hypothetical protein
MDEKQLDSLNDDCCFVPTALHLISRMIEAVEGERPTAAQCVADPLFWAAEKSIALCVQLREALEWNAKHAEHTIKAAKKNAANLRAKSDKLEAQSNVPAENKAKAKATAEAAEAEIQELEAQQNAEKLYIETLQQELEQSISGAHGDFSSEASGWPATIRIPPQGQWENHPKLSPESPLFSLLVFIRNAQQHIPQNIKKGIFSDEAQMHRFFAVDHFPWLASVLNAFIQGPLTQAAGNDHISEATRAAIKDVIRRAEQDGPMMNHHLEQYKGE